MARVSAKLYDNDMRELRESIFSEGRKVGEHEHENRQINLNVAHPKKIAKPEGYAISLRKSPPLNTEPIVRAMTKYMRKGQQISAKKQLREEIAAHDFSRSEFILLDPKTIQIEKCEPLCYRDYDKTQRPYDPNYIKSSWCHYQEVTQIYNPILAGSSPDRPFPGWRAMPNSNYWFEDVWMAQTAYYFDNLPWPQQKTDDNIICHLTGSITVTANKPGLYEWFTPAGYFYFSPIEHNRFIEPMPKPFGTRSFMDINMSMASKEPYWTVTRHIDYVFRVQPLARRLYTPNSRFLRASVTGMPTFGRYHDQHMRAESTNNLELKIYVANTL